jgi:putative nucleotidyltransferase with HDIG domain
MTGLPDKAIRLLKITGLMQYIVPELKDLVGLQQNAHHNQDAFGHTLSVLKNTKPVLVQRLMALFHDIGKSAVKTVEPDGIHFYGHEDVGADMAEQIMTRLKYPRELIDAVKTGIANHMRLKQGEDDAVKLSDKALRKFKVALGQHLEDALDVMHADNISHSDASSMPNQINNVRNRLATLDMKSDKPELPINGNDILQTFHLKPSKIVGQLLSLVTDAWYENPNLTREEALEIVKKGLGQ